MSSAIKPFEEVSVKIFQQCVLKIYSFFYVACMLTNTNRPEADMLCARASGDDSVRLFGLEEGW